ncbi:enoyl-CoA hydratase/isomerase family protein [Thioclava sp. F28-4]|uniref:enoyl-CoA hydratase-related protein n=1 Tax=Thioclava sp. F28-4 TaxID=1915315 RepID=UPI000996C8A5|nr:enoyl-CoA hydratase/isomerase family protein [Thioclava sp. F28-4]
MPRHKWGTMANRVKFRTQDGLAWLTLAALDDQGARAGITAQMRRAIGGVLDRVDGDESLRGLVLQGGAAGWPCAPDPLEDFDAIMPRPAKGEEVPSLSELCRRLGALDLPVLARLSGRIAGGSMALAQAADLRIADPDTCFAAPEFALGGFVGAGGLVRLARRIGGARALAIVAAGEEVEAEPARAQGQCDLVLGATDRSQIAAALDMLIAEGVPRTDTALDDPATYLNDLAPLRAQLGKGALAPVGARLFEVVEGALLLPLDEALDVEAVALQELLEAQLSQALRHSARVTRRAAHLPGEGTPTAPAPLRIGLWDQPAAMAGGLLAAGHEVVFGASDPAAIETAFADIARKQEIAVQSGALSPDIREADWARLGAAMTREGLSGSDALIASGKGNFPAAPLSARNAEDLPEGTNDFGLRCTGDLCELVPPEGALPADLYAMAGLLRQGGAQVLRGGPGAGGIADHLRAAYIAAAERAVLAGASVAQVDAAVREAGGARPPLELADRLGVDAVLEDFVRLHRPFGPLLSLLALDAAARGTRQQGFYDWSEGTPRPVPDQAEALAALRDEAGIMPRRLSNARIRARILAELANCGAGLLQHAQAHRAGDIDVAARHVLGFAPQMGGVMFAADRAGLLGTRKLLRELAEEGAPEPVTLWDVLIRNGKCFADLDDA